MGSMLGSVLRLFDIWVELLWRASEDKVNIANCSSLNQRDTENELALLINMMQQICVLYVTREDTVLELPKLIKNGKW